MATQVARITLPNLFDRTKSASWRDSGFIMEKCASLNVEDLRDIAAYINEAANKNIDLNASKEGLEEQIKSIALTGKLPGEVGEIDDPVVLAVNNLKRQRVMSKLKTKLENKYGY
jgi:ribosome-interacting GTPase 1